MNPKNNLSQGKITGEHTQRTACVYIRQSSIEQVRNNVESTRRQYDLADWAVELGWPRSQVRVIDEDQGKSGATPGSRSGFIGLVNSVANREVGIVIGLEVSRLARNSPDWSHLLYMCRYTGTLIADEHGIYDPSDSSDRMVLGVRGQVSELERDNSVHRMVEARWNKARRGELHYSPPAGFDISDDQELVQSCDEAVIEAVQTVFRKFEELGTARQVLIWWREQQRKFPVRHVRGRSHPIVWREPLYGMFLRMLHHPIYSGAYVFGRSKTMRDLDPDNPQQLRTKHVQSDDPILIHDHHYGYISFERYLEIQDQIKGNVMMTSDSSGATGTTREGAALLQGLTRCGKCGRRMNVSYGGSRAGGGKGGQRSSTMQYRCFAQRRNAFSANCQLIGGKGIDQLVRDEFLKVVRPATIEAAQLADDIVRREADETDRYWLLQIEKAEYEASRAERQFHAVEPENRSVARQLEQRWNQRLDQLGDLRTRAKAAQHRSDILSQEELELAAQLGVHLQAVWDADSTTQRDRKRLIRCAIEEVLLTTEEERYLIRILWKGGAATDHFITRHRPGGRATPEDTVDLVRKLAEEFDDTQIARILNRQGRKSGRDRAFTKSTVHSLRGKNHIPKCKLELTVDPATGPFTADQAAVELGVSMTTIHRWLREGMLAGQQLTRGAPWRITLSKEVRQRLSGGDVPKGWVGLQEASVLLGISKQRVAYLVKTGKLEAMRTQVGQRQCWKINVESARSRACEMQPGLFDQMDNHNNRGS